MVVATDKERVLMLAVEDEEAKFAESEAKVLDARRALEKEETELKARRQALIRARNEWNEFRLEGLLGLPAELWRKIVEDHVEERYLLGFACTCRFFRGIQKELSARKEGGWSRDLRQGQRLQSGVQTFAKFSLF